MFLKSYFAVFLFLFLISIILLVVVVIIIISYIVVFWLHFNIYLFHNGNVLVNLTLVAAYYTFSAFI